MEIGPLSEWVAAAAELLAVGVALFLPYYTARQARKHRQRGLRLLLQHLVQAAVDQEPDSIRSLDLFLKITFLGNNDPNNDQLLLVGNQILDVLRQADLSATDQRQRVTGLLGTLSLTLN